MNGSTGYETAVILAGGSGTRFERLGAVLPKCLLPVYDQPLLFRQIEQSSLAGVRHVIISIAGRHVDTLRAALRHYEPPANVSLECVPELEPLGAPEGLVKLAPYVRGRSCLVVLGDEYYAECSPFEELGALRPSTTPLTVGIICRSLPSRIACNVVLDHFGQVVRIKDKPAPSEIEGDVRWACFSGLGAGVLDLAAQLCASGKLGTPYIGDLFEMLRVAGVQTGTVEVPEIELNINTMDDLILGTLVEARRAAGSTHERASLFERALEPLLPSYGLSLADL